MAAEGKTLRRHSAILMVLLAVSLTAVASTGIPMPAPAPGPTSKAAAMSGLDPIELDIMYQLREALPELAAVGLEGGDPCLWQLNYTYTNTRNQTIILQYPFATCTGKRGNTYVSAIEIQISSYFSTAHLDLGMPINEPITFPFDLLSNLTQLTSIEIAPSPRGFTGTLPAAWSMLPLKEIDLAGNAISGTIPLSWTNSKIWEETLYNLDLSNNSLSGTLPEISFAGLAYLKYLNISSNQLTGTMPASLGKMTSLYSLSLADNKLNGTLPGAWGDSSAFGYLATLNISMNSLSGTLPDQWGDVFAFLNSTSSRSISLSLHSNEGLVGTIPASWTNIASPLTMTQCRMDGRQFYDTYVFVQPNTGICGSTPPRVVPVTFNGSALYKETLSGDRQNFFEFGNYSAPLLPSCGASAPLPAAPSPAPGSQATDTPICGLLPATTERPRNFYSRQAPLRSTDREVMFKVRDALPQLNITGDDPCDWKLDYFTSKSRVPNRYGFVKCAYNGGEAAVSEISIDGSTYGYLATLPQNGSTNVLTFPFDLLSNLSELTSILLHISQNTVLTGRLPDSWSKLALQSVDLSGNQVTGRLPSSWFSSSHLSASLSTLVLTSNNLTGSIPTSIGNARQLKLLNLGSNKLTGNLPSTLSRLNSLEGLSLFRNSLNGTMPDDWSRLSSLQFMFMNDNELSGTLPPSWGQMQDLQGLHAGSNKLTGSLPPEWGNTFSNIYYINVSNNALTGTLPSEWGSPGWVSSLYRTSIDVHNNSQLSGTVPSSWREIGSRREADVLVFVRPNTGLCGAVPAGVLTLALDGSTDLDKIDATYSGLGDAPAVEKVPLGDCAPNLD